MADEEEEEEEDGNSDDDDKEEEEDPVVAGWGKVKYQGEGRKKKPPTQPATHS